jgi:starch synthase
VNILCVASELSPHAKTGGLADVAAALPRALRRAGHDVRTFIPRYDRIAAAPLGLESALEPFEVRLGDHRYTMHVLGTDREPGTYFVHCPALYARGEIYTRDDDEHRRFIALIYAALMAAQRMGFAPDVIQCNDWQAALLPLILKCRFGWDALFAHARTLLTIHNLNYQGTFAASALPDTGLGDSAHLFHQDQLREGRINPLLHGILYADGVSTVSPTYAKEIQTPAHGARLDPFLRARRSTVVGILNGVDGDDWTPETDALLPYRYGADDLSGKERNKEALLRDLGLPYVPGVALFGVVSRLVSQKGLDLLAEVMPERLSRKDIQLIVLGSGEPALEEMFARMQRAYPKQVCFYQGYSNPLAHRIEAGADLFLMPSRYEPCGLNQMYSLRYGTAPIVHRTGGLADTVTPWDARTGRGDGFVFDHHDAAGLRWAVTEALKAYRDPAQWRRIQRNGMSKDFSWDRQAKVYELLFERLKG